MIRSFGDVVDITTDSCVAVISLISNTLTFSFKLSYFIGQLIVKLGIAIVSLLVDCITTLQTVLLVLAEDYLIFMSDVISTFSYLIDGVIGLKDIFVQALLDVCTCLGEGALGVKNCCFFIFLSVVNLLTSILNGVLYVVVLIKNSLVLVGLTSWDIFVFFPNKIISLKKCLVSSTVHGMIFVRDAVNSLRFSLQRGLEETKLFVCDIPRESMYGLLVCLSVSFVCIKYHQTIRPLLVRNVLYFLSQCQRTLVTAWAYLEAFTLWLLTNQMTPSVNGNRHPAAARLADLPAGADNRNETDHVEEEDLNRREGAAGSKREPVGLEPFERKFPSEPEERLCVVCQDSERCTIILPCRHVCLCYECCGTIKRTHGRCPICRHVVRRTMRVYI